MVKGLTKTRPFNYIAQQPLLSRAFNEGGDHLKGALAFESQTRRQTVIDEIRASLSSIDPSAMADRQHRYCCANTETYYRLAEKLGSALRQVCSCCSDDLAAPHMSAAKTGPANCRAPDVPTSTDRTL